MASSMSETPDEMVAAIGERLRALRLLKNIEQSTLAARAGIGVTALKHLESGKGSTLDTLVKVVRTLGREDWIAGIAPVPTVNPLTMTRRAEPRQRARKKGAPSA